MRISTREQYLLDFAREQFGEQLSQFLITGLGEKQVSQRGHFTITYASNENAVLKRHVQVFTSESANGSPYMPHNGTICHIWEVARVPVVLAGTKSLYELFITAQETEDVRAQLSSRVTMHYPLTGLLLSEAKALIQRELEHYATDDAVALLYNTTRGLPRYIEMLLFNLQDLIKRNSKELEAGSIKLSDLITKSASRLMLD
jgi:hypothetical protein